MLLSTPRKEASTRERHICTTAHDVVAEDSDPLETTKRISLPRAVRNVGVTSPSPPIPLPPSSSSRPVRLGVSSTPLSRLRGGSAERERCVEDPVTSVPSRGLTGLRGVEGLMACVGDKVCITYRLSSFRASGERVFTHHRALESPSELPLPLGLGLHRRLSPPCEPARKVGATEDAVVERRDRAAARGAARAAGKAGGSTEAEWGVVLPEGGHEGGAVESRGAVGPRDAGAVRLLNRAGLYWTLWSAPALWLNGGKVAVERDEQSLGQIGEVSDEDGIRAEICAGTLMFR